VAALLASAALKKALGVAHISAERSSTAAAVVSPLAQRLRRIGRARKIPGSRAADILINFLFNRRRTQAS